MDSITQIVLGAAVGELVLGRKVGNRAALWGALAGTIPDLDVISGLWLNASEYLAAHRGFSHSVFFPFLAAPILAWIPHRFGRSFDGVRYLDWMWLFFWGLITHPLIDTMTGYGTQLFNPISDYGYEWNLIFVIDPLYTLPLAAFLIAALRLRREDPRRVKRMRLGFAVSGAYLLLLVGLKSWSTPVFEQAYARVGVSTDRLMTIPGPFHSFYWRGLAESDSGYHHAYWSVFDRNREPEVFFQPRNGELLDPWRDEEAVQRLLWFSKGYYHIDTTAGHLDFHDLRFGSLFGWRGDFSRSVFVFRIDTTAVPVTFRQVTAPVDVTADDWGALFRRMFLPNQVDSVANR